MKLRIASLATAACTVALAPAAFAQSTLVIPSNVSATTEGSTSTAYPWDRDSATPASNDLRVQTIYDSTNIPVAFPILISQLRFRANASTATWAGGTFSTCEIRVGGTSVDYLAATNSFDGNWGGASPPADYAGAVVVLPGTGNGTGVPGPWYVSVVLPTPVLYDPSTGADLMIDIMHDGTFSTTAGSYTVDAGTNACVRVYNISDWQSATATTVQQNVGITCELSYTPASGLYAGFSGTPTIGNSPLAVSFTDSSYSSDPSGVQTWAWDVDNDGNDDYFTQNCSHTYTAPGKYSVKLRVTDLAHPASTETKTDYITVDPITPDFTATPTIGAAPLLVNFTDTSVGNVITTWAWDFDNDGIDDAFTQNPQWLYVATGQYSVKLTVGNGAFSESITKTNLIFASGQPVDPGVPELLQYQFNEPRGDQVANTASTALAPAFGTASNPTWQGDAGHALQDPNEPGIGCLGYTGVATSNAVDTGWPTAISGSFTIAFWQRRDPASTTTNAFGYNFSNGTFRAFCAGAAGQGITFRGSAIGNVDSGFDVTGTPGVWQHLALVVDDAAGSAQWWSNGQPGSLVTFTPNTFAYSSTSLLRVGASTATGGSSISANYDMDDFRFYTRALSAAEVLGCALAEQAAVSTFGAGCAGPGGVPTISGNGQPKLGNAGFVINVDNTEVGQIAIILIGTLAIEGGLRPLDVSSVFGAGCLAETLSDLAAFPLGTGPNNAFPLAIPNVPALAGGHAYAQGFVFGTSGAVSPALDINLQN